MSDPEFQPALALKEHMLDGHRVSALEAMAIFGVQNPNAEITRLKKDFLVKSDRVSMAKIIRRMNEVSKFSPPQNLPYKEIIMTEYWISR